MAVIVGVGVMEAVKVTVGVLVMVGVKLIVGVRVAVRVLVSVIVDVGMGAVGVAVANKLNGNPPAEQAASSKVKSRKHNISLILITTCLPLVSC